jgi:Fur family zinc uptake transcriptional regulator
MAGIAMARRKRGLGGFLHQRVLRLLKAAHPHPRTGLQLAELLQREGDQVSVSQVYRALRRLIGEGEIRKVLVAGGYAPVWHEPAMLFWCRGCETLQAMPCPEAFRRLDTVAAAAGFAAARAVIEVPGLCAHCAAALPTPR